MKEIFQAIEFILRLFCSSMCLSFGIVGGGFVIWWYGYSIRETTKQDVYWKKKNKDAEDE